MPQDKPARSRFDVIRPIRVFTNVTRVEHTWTFLGVDYQLRYILWMGVLCAPAAVWLFVSIEHTWPFQAIVFPPVIYLAIALMAQWAWIRSYQKKSPLPIPVYRKFSRRHGKNPWWYNIPEAEADSEGWVMLDKAM